MRKGATRRLRKRWTCAWPEHVNQALAVLHTSREPDSRMADAGDADVWERMIEAAIEEAEATAA